MTGPERTAGLIIELLPAVQPGTVYIRIGNTGPETLTREESIDVLRKALAIVAGGKAGT